MMMENMDGDIVGYYKKIIMGNIMSKISDIEAEVEKTIRKEIEQPDSPPKKAATISDISNHPLKLRKVKKTKKTTVKLSSKKKEDKEIIIDPEKVIVRPPILINEASSKPKKQGRPKKIKPETISENNVETVEVKKINETHGS
jgi:hypothetical protein